MKIRAATLRRSRIGALAILAFAGSACASSRPGPFDEPPTPTPTPATGEPDTTVFGAPETACAKGAKTSVSGVVLDPAGKVPLYNVVVYIPNGEVAPFVEGATCSTCSATLAGAVRVATLTDSRGQFKLDDVPASGPLTVIVQVGKWRRKVALPTPKACVDNPIADTELTRLPRSRAEGDLPRIALTTGGADPLECLLRKIGIDESEFTTGSGDGRVHLFAGSGGTNRFAPTLNAGAAFTSPTSYWADAAKIQKYDIVFHACEGDNDADKPADAKAAMQAYTRAGGRVFLSHFTHRFIRGGGFPEVATWTDQNLGNTNASVVTSFPKGAAMADWLVSVGASPTKGELPLRDAQRSIATVFPAVAQAWVEVPPTSVQIMSFNTPADVPAAEQCGKVVVTDIHISADSTVNRPFPTGCTSPNLTAQEKALEFMLFDLGACIQNENEAPTAPR